MSKLDLKGQKYGRLLVLCEHSERKNDKKKSTQWVCQCDCGNEVIVPTRSLREKHTQSCGCFLRSVNNMSYTRQWRIWVGMKDRCNRVTSTKYEYYGGKGITYDKKWEDFNNFWKDMHEGYSDTLTLDRIDSKGNYEPSNCKWSTMMEQNSNKCNNIFYKVNGIFKTLETLAREYGINYTTLYSRVNRSKWSIEKALSEPIRVW